MRAHLQNLDLSESGVTHLQSVRIGLSLSQEKLDSGHLKKESQILLLT